MLVINSTECVTLCSSWDIFGFELHWEIMSFRSSARWPSTVSAGSTPAPMPSYVQPLTNYVAGFCTLVNNNNNYRLQIFTKIVTGSVKFSTTMVCAFLVTIFNFNWGFCCLKLYNQSTSHTPAATIPGITSRMQAARSQSPPWWPLLRYIEDGYLCLTDGSQEFSPKLWNGRPEIFISGLGSPPGQVCLTYFGRDFPNKPQRTRCDSCKICSMAMTSTAVVLMCILFHIVTP